MQFLANSYGATVQRQHGEVGAVKMLIYADHPFFGFFLKPFSQTQHIMSPPQICPSFLDLAHSKDCSIQIIGHNKIKP
jgi:GMP synthase-like glutamine amidotransferase